MLVPLLPLTEAPAALGGLNPILRIDGEPHRFMPQWLAAAPRRSLGRPITSLAAERDAITRALDLLSSGF